MATKSSNTQGNPYHDEATGEFTSGDSSSTKVSSSKGIRLKEGVDIPSLLQSKVKVKMSGGLDSLISKLNDINEASNVPVLKTAKDIENNVEHFFSKQVTEKIDALYASTNDCSSYQFHPKSNPHMTLEIFPNVLGKYRYKDNHAQIVDSTEFGRIANSLPGRELIYRGISSNGEKARAIVGSYGKVDLENFDYYCPNGGNCYGSNVYTTIQRSYAMSYCWGNGTLIQGILDTRGANFMSYSRVASIMNGIDQSVIYNKVSERLKRNGLEEARANRIAKSFSNAIKTDTGIVAICLGLDYYIAANHQRNLFNLKKWIIREV